MIGTKVALASPKEIQSTPMYQPRKPLSLLAKSAISTPVNLMDIALVGAIHRVVVLVVPIIIRIALLVVRRLPFEGLSLRFRVAKASSNV
jgi:hypothetical protein